MIIKEKVPTPNLLKLNALLDRLHPEHQKYNLVSKECYNKNAGYQGEKSLDYYLSFLDEKKYSIFHDLRFSNGKHFFQIDLMILTNQYCLIIESKNISGELHFDPKFNQLIKESNGKVEVLGDPFAQVRHQRNQLIDFCNKHNLPPLRIEYLVALTNKKALIKQVTGSQGEQRKLCRGANLLEKIKEYERYPNPDPTSPKELKRIIKTFLKNNTLLNENILKQFNIPKEDLLTGVKCPNCSSLPMKHVFGKWSCPVCSYQSKDAHKQALNDYFLLLGPEITNREFRWFMQIPQRQIASNMLASLDLVASGVNKGRVYSIKD